MRGGGVEEECSGFKMNGPKEKKIFFFFKQKTAYEILA